MARSVRVSVAPGILKHFRETSGYTVDEVGKKLKMSPEDVERLDSGGTLTMAQIEKLSAAFKYPSAMFFLPAPPKQKPVKDYRFLPDGRSTFRRETLMAVRESRYLQGIGLELLENLGRPAELKAEKTSLDDSPAGAASKYRGAFGLTEDRQLEFGDACDMYRYLRRALESLNVFAFEFSLPADARGFALADESPAVVAASSRDALEDRQFALMHEFGHALLGDACVDAPEAGVGRTGRELWCDEFSSLFLLPDGIARAAFSEHGDACAPEALKLLSKKYKVGEALLLHRMNASGSISDARYSEAKSRRGAPAARARGSRRSAPRRCASKLGDAFVSLVSDNLDGEHITYADALDYLSVKSRHFDDVVARAHAHSAPDEQRTRRP